MSRRLDEVFELENMKTEAEISHHDMYIDSYYHDKYQDSYDDRYIDSYYDDTSKYDDAR